jgi:hypothetical protein
MRRSLDPDGASLVRSDGKIFFARTHSSVRRRGLGEAVMLERRSQGGRFRVMLTAIQPHGSFLSSPSVHGNVR